MKKRHKKAAELVADGKQQAFDMPDAPAPTETKKKLRKATPTYWRCANNHIFEMKVYIHENRINDLGCPICNKKVLNKSTKSTYLAFLDKTGRGNKMKYVGEKKKIERKVAAKLLRQKEDTED
jgi:hypothetical protein